MIVSVFGTLSRQNRRSHKTSHSRSIIAQNRVMSSVNDAISSERDSGRFHSEVNGGTPVFFICSPRPRVGKTLIVRLLTEFFLFDGRSVVAFDASPNDASLSRYLPDCTIPATISDIKSQMALFDRLMINDTKPKIVDLAAEQFDPFFLLMGNIGFLEEAPKQSITPVILFVADGQPISSKAYEQVWRRFSDSLLFPVHNQATMAVWHYGHFPTRHANGVPLRIPCLPWRLTGILKRRDFSFMKCLDTPVDFPTELYEWIGRSFLAFRELQLCILMENFRPLFTRGRIQRDARSGAQEADGPGRERAATELSVDI
jgi:hypothetical protein